MDKKFIIGISNILLLVLLLPMVLSFEFDNVKSYDSKVQTVKITNSFGYGKDLAEIKLNTPLVYNVIRGKNRLVAELDFKINEAFNYDELFKTIEFYNIKNNNDVVSRKFEYKIKEIYYVDEPVLIEVCEEGWTPETDALTNHCKTQEKGTYQREMVRWKSIDKSLELKEGIITVGIFTNVYPKETIEWIPTVLGKKLDEFAVFNETLQAGLFAYYDFNSSNSTNTLVPEMLNGTYNVSLSGDFHTGSGKFGKALEFNETNDAVFQQQWAIDDKTWSFSFWMNLSGDSPTIFGDADFVGSNGGWLLGVQQSLGRVEVYNANVGQQELRATIPSISDGLYHHIIVILPTNNAFQKVYVDGVNQTITISNAPLDRDSTSTAQNPLRFGSEKGRPYSTHNLVGNLDEFAVWDRVLSGSEIAQLYDGGTGTFFVRTPADPVPIVTSNIPANSLFTNQTTITFNCSAIDDTEITNITLYLDGVANYTATIGGTNASTMQVTLGLAEGNYVWNCSARDDVNQEGSSANRNLEVHLTTPQIVIEHPRDSEVYLFQKLGNNLTFNWTIVEAGRNLTDHLTKCYSTYNGIQTNISIVNCTNRNNTIVTYVKNANAISLTIEDKANFVTTNTSNFDYKIVEARESYDLVALQGTTSTFFLDVIVGGGLSLSSANLIYNGTAYSTSSIVSGSSYNLSAIATPPALTGTQNVSWYWNLILSDSTEYNYTSKLQTVTSIDIDDCSLFTTNFINLTLKDEATQSVLNQTTYNTSIEVQITVYQKGTEISVINYSSLFSQKNPVKICLSTPLNTSTFDFDMIIGYKADGYVQRFYFLDNGTLDSTGQFNSYTNGNITLFDLLTTDSTSFLFSFTDVTGGNKPEVVIHTFRKYIGEGSFKEVERSKQDNNGETIVHLVEEDVIYYFMVTEEGQIIYTSSLLNQAKCLTVPCGISLTASTSEVNWSIIDNSGRKYQLTQYKPTRTIRLDFTGLSSQTVNLTLYRYNNGEIEAINTTHLTAMSGSLILSVPNAYGNQSFFANVHSNSVVVLSRWIDFRESGKDYFGTFGGILAGLLLLTIIFMSISEGIALVILTIVAFLFIFFLQLLELSWASVISIICVGGIIVWKLIQKRGGGQ